VQDCEWAKQPAGKTICTKRPSLSPNGQSNSNTEPTPINPRGPAAAVAGAAAAAAAAVAVQQPGRTTQRDLKTEPPVPTWVVSSRAASATSRVGQMATARVNSMRLPADICAGASQARAGGKRRDCHSGSTGSVGSRHTPSVQVG
jgi:hypothetical protein